MNFLARQAARSLSRGAIVRPRLPALFEPASEGPVPEPVASETPQPVAPQPTRTQLMEEVLRREVQTVREVIERVVPRDRIVVEERRSRLSEEAPRGGQAILPVREEAGLRLDGQAGLPVLHQKTIVDHEVAPPPERVIERTREIASPQIETHTKSERVIDRERVVETRPTVMPVPVTMPAIVRPRESAQAPVVVQSAPEAAPTIRVTIGRVEVRAVLDAPQPQQSKPVPQTPPSLSLEDYLRQRGSR